ncbi:unnamed protein product [Dicrocoelium dendriticum]|nr:unnamed protein product [Dicrocoelium dendriticum]
MAHYSNSVFLDQNKHELPAYIYSGGVNRDATSSTTSHATWAGVQCIQAVPSSSIICAAPASCLSNACSRNDGLHNDPRASEPSGIDSVFASRTISDKAIKSETANELSDYSLSTCAAIFNPDRESCFVPLLNTGVWGHAYLNQVAALTQTPVSPSNGVRIGYHSQPEMLLDFQPINGDITVVSPDISVSQLQQALVANADYASAHGDAQLVDAYSQPVNATNGFDSRPTDSTSSALHSIFTTNKIIHPLYGAFNFIADTSTANPDVDEYSAKKSVYHDSPAPNLNAALINFATSVSASELSGTNVQPSHVDPWWDNHTSGTASANLGKFSSMRDHIYSDPTYYARGPSDLTSQLPEMSSAYRSYQHLTESIRMQSDASCGKSRLHTLFTCDRVHLLLKRIWYPNALFVVLTHR